MKACLLPKISNFNLRGRGLRKRGNGEGEVDYLREAIISNISVKGFDYSRSRLIEGRLFFEEIRYTRYYAVTITVISHILYAFVLHSLCAIYYEDKTNRRLWGNQMITTPDTYSPEFDFLWVKCQLKVCYCSFEIFAPITANIVLMRTAFVELWFGTAQGELPAVCRTRTLPWQVDFVIRL